MNILLVIAAVLLLAFAAVGVAFYLRPLDFLVAAARRKLRGAGLERRALGETVYWTGGSGPILLLLHGVNDHAGTWYKNVPALKEQFRLIVPDLPGHGESGPREGELTFDAMLAAVEKVVDAEAPAESLVVAGNSMGGWLALLFALRHPSRVKGLVLETSGGLEFETENLNLTPATRDEARRLASLVWGPDIPKLPNYILDDMVRKARTAPVRRLHESTARMYLVEDEQLRTVEAPTTLVWGDSDGILPLEYAESLRSRIPDARLHVLTRCGHIPHREKPAEYVEIIVGNHGAAAVPGEGREGDAAR
jgi:pimeloyl-ACP methyl ester carboxylesterase